MKITIPINVEITFEKNKDGLLLIKNMTANTNDLDVDQDLLNDIVEMIDQSNFIEDIRDIVYVKYDRSQLFS